MCRTVGTVPLGGEPHAGLSTARAGGTKWCPAPHSAVIFRGFALLPATLRTALGNLRRNKMRAALTALGVVIGVAAVIAMTEIGKGSQAAIEKTIANMGAFKLPIFPAPASTRGVKQGHWHFSDDETGGRRGDRLRMSCRRCRCAHGLCQGPGRLWQPQLGPAAADGHHAATTSSPAIGKTSRKASASPTTTSARATPSA